MPPSPGGGAPVTEAELHAYADGQLPAARLAAIEAYLARNPEAQQRVRDWTAQNLALQQWLAPVLAEPIPLRIPVAPPLAVRRHGWWRGVAAGVLIAAASAGSSWWLRGAVDGADARIALAQAAAPASSAALPAFVQRAAVAHAVYTPDQRRPVEVGADQEQALVTWLTRRLGTSVRVPDLRAQGYQLVGGRLLPGANGPVAQFMFSGPQQERMTLYLTREAAGRATAFRFGRDDDVNVFYWVDQDFGYALSGGSRAELARVAQAVYAQLAPR